jgi:hypothetical protein
MIESKHTPGPWKAQLREGYVRHHAKGQWEVVSAYETEWWIADAAPHTGCDEANARLIAAAPELLAALETVLSWAEPVAGDNRDKEAAANEEASIALARAAIAKAEGETP